MKNQAVSPRHQGQVPLLDIEGSLEECGLRIGYAWREVLQLQATRNGPGTPWWQQRCYEKVIQRYAPYFPTLFTAMAKGADLPPEAIGSPKLGRPASGCTSFAIQPEATLDGHPISGQTKDTPADRQHRFVVLRLKPTDAHPVLTLTYPGELYGQGFARGGCSVFRNALNAGPSGGELPYMAWGLLVQRCPTVDDAVALTREHVPNEGFHCTIADEHGGIVGIECGKHGLKTLQPKHGIYTHANAALCLERCENDLGDYETDSPVRETRLRELFEQNHGRLTAQLAYAAFCDHENYPTSLCRHQGDRAVTTAAVIAEPTRNRLHVTRGNPCQHWPCTFRL